MPDLQPYDALLLVSFGGPEKPGDVVPFLRNVTAGRDIPEERLVEVGRHYLDRGAPSAQMKADGVSRAAALLTSAYSSYSGCRQYREDLADAVAGVPGAPRVDRLRAYFNHPGLLEPLVD